jgi:transcriptional regulator with PAS, ATPase and Fis domain
LEALLSIIGHQGGLHEVVERARRLAGVNTPVLLQGETGVGKEVFARAIHEQSPQQRAPFVALNCGGLSRELLASELFGYVDGAFTGARRSGMVGKIEAAHGGTLLLDEVAELPLDLQPYLLRVLEGGELYPLGSNKPRQVSFRLISACNRPLRSEAEAGRFRMDLFYRISVLSLRLPALRERVQDLPELVEHFSSLAAQKHGMAPKPFVPAVLQAFARYPWPGNVRELRNVVEAMLLLANGDDVGLDALPAELTSESPMPAEEARSSGFCPAPVGLGRVECEAIRAAIVARQGNLTQVARDLHISRSTLYLKLKKHALDPVLTEARLTA